MHSLVWESRVWESRVWESRGVCDYRELTLPDLDLDLHSLEWESRVWESRVWTGSLESSHSELLTCLCTL